MRVAYVISGLATRAGGPAILTVEACQALKLRGVESTIFTTDMARAASAASNERVTLGGLPTGAADLDIRLCRTRWPYRFAFSPSLYRELHAELRAYDVVHIQQFFLFPDLAAYLELRPRRVPYVVAPHGTLEPYLRKRGRARKAVAETLWVNPLLNGASAIQVTTAAEAAAITHIAPNVPRAIVPNGIHWQFWQNSPDGMLFRNRFLNGYTGAIVMNIGRKSFKKGLDILIYAFDAVRKVVPDLKLVLVGPDDEGYSLKLRHIVDILGISEYVTCIGMLTGEDRKAALSAADVWLLSSHTENFSIAAVEAMAAGTPVVISRGVQLSSDVQKHGAGLVCELDVTSISDAILSVLNDARLASRLSGAAREYSRRYDWQNVSLQLRDLYERIARNRP